MRKNNRKNIINITRAVIERKPVFDRGVRAVHANVKLKLAEKSMKNGKG